MQDFILHDDNFKYFLNNLKKKDLHKNFMAWEDAQIIMELIFEKNLIF